MKILGRIALLVYKGLAKIPYSVLMSIGTFALNIIFPFHLFPFQRVTRRNLRAAFPSYTKIILSEIEYNYYKNALDFSIELLESFSCKKSKLSVNFLNMDVLQKAFESTDFVVCYCGHFLNYEVLTCLPAQYPEYEMYCYYQPSGLKEIDEYVERARSRYGAHLIPTTSPLRKLLELKKNNDDRKARKKYLIGSLADLKPVNNQITSISFLNQYMYIYNGTEKIGTRLNASFLYADISCHSKNVFDVEFKQLDSHSPKSSLTDQYFLFLQDNIKRQPEIWMLWGTERFIEST